MDAQLHAQLNDLYRVDFQHNVHPPKDERLGSAIEEYIQTRLDIVSISPPSLDFYAEVQI